MKRDFKFFNQLFSNLITNFHVTYFYKHEDYKRCLCYAYPVREEYDSRHCGNVRFFLHDQTTSLGQYFAAQNIYICSGLILAILANVTPQKILGVLDICIRSKNFKP